MTAQETVRKEALAAEAVGPWYVASVSAPILTLDYSARKTTTFQEMKTSVAQARRTPCVAVGGNVWRDSANAICQ